MSDIECTCCGLHYKGLVSFIDGYNSSLHLMINMTPLNVLAETIKQVDDDLGQSGRIHAVTTRQELHLTVGHSFCYLKAGPSGSPDPFIG